MLRTADPVAAEKAVNLLSPGAGGEGLTHFLKSSRFMRFIDLTAEQAGVDWNGGKVVFFSAVSTFLAAFAAAQIPVTFFRIAFVAVVALLGGALPFIILFRKRAKRLAAFEEQFPEALDFISRSMRAGHGFSVAMEMLVLDSPEPLASSFRRVLSDVHLGSPLDAALGKLAGLVPLLDVRFFTASVLLQQETGGNLGEILSKLSHIIRERFRLKGQVKAASAHGRITGLVLLFMPIVVALVLFVVSPLYLMALFTEEKGREMLGFAAAAQVLGYFCIKKIVNIKV
jgi:tight adherence protein B